MSISFTENDDEAVYEFHSSLSFDPFGKGSIVFQIEEENEPNEGVTRFIQEFQKRYRDLWPQIKKGYCSMIGRGQSFTRRIKELWFTSTIFRLFHQKNGHWITSYSLRMDINWGWGWNSNVGFQMIISSDLTSQSVEETKHLYRYHSQQKPLSCLNTLCVFA